MTRNAVGCVEVDPIKVSVYVLFQRLCQKRLGSVLRHRSSKVLAALSAVDLR